MAYHQIKEANKTLRDYAMPSINGAHFYYKEALAIQAGNFERGYLRRILMFISQTF